MFESIQLSVPKPCHENWQQMTPNEQGRHCLSCQKTVVDFSVMSDQQVLHYFSAANERVCGRFNPDQLNRTIDEKKARRLFSWRYVWHVVIVGFLLGGCEEPRTLGEPALTGDTTCTKDPAKNATDTIATIDSTGKFDLKQQ